MTADLQALLAHARDTDALTRSRMAAAAAGQQPGRVLLVTCHRVEMYGDAAALASMTGDGWESASRWSGDAAASHLIRVAVGLESAIVGEDQVLFQIRRALQAARIVGRLPAHIDRLFDMALRAGRTGRSWLPSKRPNLAQLALDRVAGEGGHVGRVMVVGVGQIGRLAALAVRERGGEPVVTSRTAERAQAVAQQLAAPTTAFLPDPRDLRGLTGIVVALAGRWPLSVAASQALAGSSAWVVDLSSPPALETEVRTRLGERLIEVDDLALGRDDEPSGQLVARLEALADRTLHQYLAWAASARQRAAAEALRERAASAEALELEKLWQRVPGVSADEREEVARAFRRLSDRLLSDPLEKLGNDADGGQARAARELFRL